MSNLDFSRPFYSDFLTFERRAVCLYSSRLRPWRQLLAITSVVVRLVVAPIFFQRFIIRVEFWCQNLTEWLQHLNSQAGVSPDLATRSVFQRSGLDLDRFPKMAKKYPLLILIFRFLKGFRTLTGKINESFLRSRIECRLEFKTHIREIKIMY